jgi:hypothetical protein
MKNFFKIISVVFSFLFISSCSSDDKTVLSSNGFELRTTTLNSPLILNPANDNDVVSVLEWDSSNTGTPTVSTYTVEVSESGTNEPMVTANLGGDLGIDVRTYTLKVAEINKLVNLLPNYACGQEIAIDVRIKAKVGGSSYNAFVQYSNPITIRVSPYSTAKLLLAFSKDPSLVNTADKLASSSFTNSNDYEGYMYLESGTYKFYKPNSCNEFSSPTVYGLSGASTGSLTLDGSTGFTVATAGHYYIKANLSDTGAGSLTYSIAAFNATTNTFGVFGKALRPVIGSANTTPMNYNPTTKKWSVTVDMVNGLKFGFKTSSTAPIASLEGTGTGTLTESPLKTITTGAPTDGSIKAPGDFVDNNTKTKYDIEVDLSKPRNYTYKLTVVPN